MSNYLYSNNAATVLASGINNTDLSLSVSAGTGTLFPNPSAGQQFNVTLVEGATTEIVKVTARSTDAFTIVRAQEGTTAQSFTSAAKVELRVTAEGLNQFVGGAASATDGNIPVFDGVTGKLIKDTGITPASLSTSLAVIQANALLF